MRRTVVGTVKALALGVLLVMGCNRLDIEVVKLLPDPPLSSKAARSRRTAAAPKPTVARKPNHAQDGPPGWVPPGGISQRWQCIVVHHSASATGCASDFHQAHLQRGWDELGYHFVIGNGTGSADGQVEVGSRWYKQKHGAHCKTAGNYHNEHGIGICLVGNFDRSYPTPRQMASLKKLLRFLMAKRGISWNRVIGHREAPGASTRCPGAHLSLARLRAALQNDAIASGF